ncbi:uncharacterized protein LOC119414032, partial [Nematolebias whitei]|uniref:uncharacterized protein LOC119414032 n=1 Tax=Nematolebias whitei TaxID=451745 RepID=UPI00189B5673
MSFLLGVVGISQRPGTSRLLTTQQTLNGTENEASNSTSLGLTPSPSTPPTTPAITMSTEDLKPTSASGSGDKKIKVTSAPTTTSAASAGGSSKAGLAVLVLIILIIIILCIILLRLRRASRTHSFDLQGFGPSRRLDEPTGTFGRVYVDDLGRHAPKDVETTEELTTTPAANGTSPEPVEKGPSEENGTSVVPREQPGTSEVQNSPCSSFGSSLEDERARTTSVKLSSNNLFLDAAEEQQQNENNNNPAVGSSSPFVEIDLDEPAWCDQLLTSPPP